MLVVDKPTGPTSHDVVQVARRSFGARVGHTGTLDPLASGVLPLVLGRATRLARFLSAGEKTYEATVVFGRETDTYDAAGRTTAETGDAPGGRGARRAGRGAARPPAADTAGLLGQEDRRRGRASPRPARRGNRPGAGRRRDSRSDAARRGSSRGPPAAARLRRVLRARRWPTTWGDSWAPAPTWGRSVGCASGPFGLDDAVSWAPGRHPEPGSAGGGHPARAPADRPACGPPRRRDRRPGPPRAPGRRPGGRLAGGPGHGPPVRSGRTPGRRGRRRWHGPRTGRWPGGPEISRPAAGD